MATITKSQMYQWLKNKGVAFSKPYVNYSVAEMEQLVLDNGGGFPAGYTPQSARTAPAAPASIKGAPVAPQAARPVDPDFPDVEPEVESGLLWYQREVVRPTMATPRARLKRTIKGPGSTKAVKVAENERYSDVVEVPGEGQVDIVITRTLPSWQVGIYRDPNLPFKTVVYKDQSGFFRQDVERYYGGANLVPASISKMYVGNLLAFSIQDTVREIEHEFRQHQLAGRI